MARPLRPEHHGAVWHAYNRGVNRSNIFFRDENRLLFLALLAEAVRRFRWVIHQFTLITWGWGSVLHSAVEGWLINRANLLVTQKLDYDGTLGFRRELEI